MIPIPGQKSMGFDIRAARGSARYKRERHQFLIENPLCAGCKKRGIKRGAKELDHILPAEERPDLFWDHSNWQGLCVRCHEAKTADENRREETPGEQAWSARLQRAYGYKAPRHRTDA